MNTVKTLPLWRQPVLAATVLVMLVLLLWPQNKLAAEITVPLSIEPSEAAPEFVFQQPSATIAPLPNADSLNSLYYAVAEGDTLSTIFDRLNIGQQAMYEVLAADIELLALDVLRPGQTIIFHTDALTDKLAVMELVIHVGNRIRYHRNEDGTFYFEEFILPGTWKTEVLSGEIYGSFYYSAEQAGLTAREIQEVATLFREQLDFARQIQAGDKFEIVRASQFVETQATGETRIEAVRIHRRTKTHTAFLFEDGNYYDVEGKSLARAFNRYPVDQRYRISSAFNPSRLHPITGKISPHNGTDFAVPRGTPVYATGDGVVTRVENHPYAGKYIVIEHSGQYRTRFLHLDRILVRKGQRVSRGERIALSGNTGRSTGPHLHFEFHINGRPVNAMRAQIPLASSVASAKLPDFKARVADIESMIESSSPLASRE
ncbi:peptidoglycan DD-metalloendopeptidase family protein [Salinibius halmophilus]|uniref:peptidoglycan DD-metalloendopeptidase family protein n=1 Tax=Salinibius halmophilus TaxID=1853216 RepID=UPI000E65FC09|nr:peptidoglycan DD-metalloendopeptidase family protein [Salinibius halmophilus]